MHPQLLASVLCWKLLRSNVVAVRETIPKPRDAPHHSANMIGGFSVYPRRSVVDSQEIIKHLFEEFWFDGFAWSMMLLVCVPSACCSVGACLQTAGLVHCGTQLDKGASLAAHGRWNMS